AQSPVRPPATIIAFPKAEDYKTMPFDTRSPIKVVGEIKQVDTGADGTKIAWVLAKVVYQEGPTTRPNTPISSPGEGEIWRVEGRALTKIKPADQPKLAAGTRVFVYGLNSNDKSCKPTCRIKADGIDFR